MKPFWTSFMGSLPRGNEIMHARRLVQAHRMSEADLSELVRIKTLEAVRMQEKIGLDAIVSGELGRENYVSFIAGKIGGVREMSMAEMMDYIDDKQSFEQILTTLDVPATSMKNAICTGKLLYTGDIALGELRMLREMTDRPIKITLPGPYLATRSMWLPELSGKVYSSKEVLGDDLLEIYRLEIEALQAEGVDIIQFDEPVLTEVVFSPERTRTFMCAALSQKKDPKEELEFAGHLIGNAIACVDRSKSIASLHVCRGNWSRDESILLSGPYTPLIDLFARVQPDMLALEFSTPRAGELGVFLADPHICGKIAFGLGSQNPRTDEIESPAEIVDRATQALTYLTPSQIALNPDCGFATFSARPVSTMQVIEAKGTSLVEASRILRSRYATE